MIENKKKHAYVLIFFVAVCFLLLGWLLLRRWLLLRPLLVLSFIVVGFLFSASSLVLLGVIILLYAVYGGSMDP
jgi:hypothetical protein